MAAGNTRCLACAVQTFSLWQCVRIVFSVKFAVWLGAGVPVHKNLSFITYLVSGGGHIHPTGFLSVSNKTVYVKEP